MTMTSRASWVRLPSQVAMVEAMAGDWGWDTHGPNVVLTGPQGAGKSAVITELSRLLESRVQVIRWRAGAEVGGADFTGVVVGGRPLTDEPPLLDTVAAYVRARNWLHDHAGDRPLLVVVDDVHLVPEAYRKVLAELSRNNEITVLAATTSVRLAGRALTQMWRDGLITDRRVPELGIDDVVELMRGILGGGVDLAAATAVRGASAGILGYAAAALRARGGRADDAGASTEALHTALGRAHLSAGQRSILEVLSELREFPAAILVSLFGPSDLDDLMDRAVLRLHGRGSSRCVVIADPWVAKLVRETTTESRERELYEALEPYGSDPRISSAAAADLLLWRHRLGLGLDEATVARYAEQAADDADYATVRALIQTLGDVSHAPHLHGLLTLALASLGEIDAATELARPLLEADTTGDHVASTGAQRIPDGSKEGSAEVSTSSAVTRTAEALYVLAAMSTLQRRGAGEFEHLLRRADQYHALLKRHGDPNQTPAQVAALEEAAMAARWILINFRGDYQTLVESITRASLARRVDRTTRALMVGLTAKASAICGRPADGQAVLARAVKVDATARNAQLAHQHTRDAAMIGQIFGGQWAHLMEQVRKQDVGMAHNSGWVQQNMLLGALLLLAGRPDSAVKYLETALRATDDGHDFPVPKLVISATACAYAWVGRRDSAKGLLRMRRQVQAQESYLYQAVGEYFTGLTEFLLGDVAAGVQRWRSWADDTMARGCDGLALVFLQALARVGSELAIRNLANVAGRCQGPWAETLVHLAQALGQERITDMRAALRSAAAMGEMSLVGYLEALIADRTGNIATGQVLPFPKDEAGQVATGEMDTRAVAMAAVLTTREREIADLAAAGLTNQAIAQEIGLSRRTVEGHMRQILRKLNMTRRTELLEFGGH